MLTELYNCLTDKIGQELVVFLFFHPKKLGWFLWGYEYKDKPDLVKKILKENTESKLPFENKME